MPHTYHTRRHISIKAYSSTTESADMHVKQIRVEDEAGQAIKRLNIFKILHSTHVIKRCSPLHKIVVSYITETKTTTLSNLYLSMDGKTSY